MRLCIKKILLPIVLLNVVCAVYAQDFNYEYIEAGFASSEVSNGSVSLTGQTFFIEAYHEVSANIFIIGGLDLTDLEEKTLGLVTGTGDEKDFLAGAGYHHRIYQQTDAVYTGTLLQSNSDFKGISTSDSGYGLSVGLRHWLFDSVELNGGLDYENIFSSNTNYNVGAIIYLQNTLILDFLYIKDTNSSFDAFTFGFKIRV